MLKVPRVLTVLVPRVLTVLTVLAVLCILSATLPAQPPSRVATTAEALTAAPVFFNGKQVVVRREVDPATTPMRLKDTAKPVFVYWRDSPNLSRDTEVRGDFWDLGRIDRNDSRFSSVNFDPILQTLPNNAWPARDQVFMIMNATGTESPLPPEPTLRSLALAPDQYIGKGVTITGRFRGANLFADLPTGAGTKGRWDFVMQSADAAIWVTGVRPRGRGFDLDINARMDAGRWLQIAGTLRRDGPLPFIEATSIAEARPPNEQLVEIVLPPRAPEMAPTVVFSAPTGGETDAERAMAIRIQFSRDMDPRSFANHIRLSYIGNAPPGAPLIPSFSFRYVEGNHALEIKPSQPLDRFRVVKIDLIEGIVSAIDNQPLKPWSLTFTTGG